MPAKLLAHVAVKAKMVEEIMPLKNAMILHNPKNFFRHKWFQYRRSNVGMVGGAQRIANVMQQGHHHIFLVPAIAMGARRGL